MKAQATLPPQLDDFFGQVSTRIPTAPAAQPQPEAGPTASDRAAKIGLMAVFAGGVFLFSRKQHKPLSALDWVTLTFAVTRIGRMIASDNVTEPLRAPVAITQDHPHFDKTTEPKYSDGWKHSLGQLVTCPTCAGTWAAAALVYGMAIAPGPTMLFARIMSLVGLAELAGAAIEAACWAAAAARRFTGRGLA